MAIFTSPSSMHPVTEGAYTPDVVPDPFSLSREIDPKGIINIRSVGNFVLRVHEAQANAGNKHAVPPLSQWMNVPHLRKAFGHVIVADTLYLASRLPQQPAVEWLTKATALAEGRQVFSVLDAHREGHEGTIPAAVRKNYPMPFERDPDESLQLQVGRRVAELIAANYPGAGGAAHDALLALEMHTDQQIATTEAIAA